MKNKYNKIIFLLMFFTIVFTIAGSTLAYWSWQTSEAQKTEVTFTVTKDFECAADGGGSITSGDAFIAPSSCTSTHAIKRELTVMPTIYGDNLSINMELYLDVNSLDTGLANSDNFRYAVTTSSTSCETGVISSGNLKGLTTGKQVRILNKNYSSSTPQKYYLYIWLDKAETSQSTMDQSFNLSISGNCTDELKPEEPVLDEGMIPVTISNNGTVKTILPGDKDWHDYENKEWANVVLVDNDSRSTYKNTTGVTVNQSDILAYYTWIPRYSYRIPSEVECSKINNPSLEKHSGCYAPYTISDSDKEMLIQIVQVYVVNNLGISNFSPEQSRALTTEALQTGVYVIDYNGNKQIMLLPDAISTANSMAGTNIVVTPSSFNANNTTLAYSNVPREIDISFESGTSQMIYGDAINTYRTHPAFWWDNDSDGIVDSGETKSGIWVGKFESSGNATIPKILPNVSMLTMQNVSTQFTTSRKFSVSGNAYGLSNVSTDAHMMKNSEWGAVAYLSHSKYGINNEIRINNNSNYKTGCGASTENGSYTSTCEIAYGGATSYPQSTTGNITGIFDMSGGTGERVMGVLADSNGNPRSGYTSASNSGFNGLLEDGTSYTSGINFPENKYYDLYTSEISTTACNGGICYGHALSETANWYEDYSGFVNSGSSWFYRGGFFINGSYAGAFLSDFDSGNIGDLSWRSVLVL